MMPVEARTTVFALSSADQVTPTRGARLFLSTRKLRVAS